MNERSRAAGEAFAAAMTEEDRQRFLSGAKERIARWKAYFQAVLAEGRAEYAGYGATYPESIEEWMTLARRVGMSADRVLEGDWTAREIDALARGYFESLADSRKLADSADSKTDNEKKPGALVPANPDVARLAREIKKRLPRGDTKRQIALDYAGRDEKRADSLLRQLRRFPALLE